MKKDAMNRRGFFVEAGVLGSTLALLPGSVTASPEQSVAGRGTTGSTTGSAPENTHRRGEIAGMSLEALRDLYRHDLFEDYLPFWDAHGIDREFGGFLCFMDHDGTVLNTDKSMWHQGRGLWVYSFLYNHFGDDRHLEIARRTRDFLVRHGRDEQGEWVETLHRDGRIKTPANGLGFAGMYVAQGLQEFYKATGDQASMDLAIDSFWRSAAIFDDPHRSVQQRYIPHEYPGQRTLGFEMVTIRLLTQILEQVADPKLEVRAARTMDVMMNRFWNPEYRLYNDALTHDFARPEDDNEDFVYLGHAIEISWMLLHEAMRVRDQALFDLAAERFRRYIEVAWDPVFEGVFYSLRVNDGYTFAKALWAQEEVLIGTMMLMEHTDLDWPALWFDKMYRYVRDKYPLEPYGYPLWMLYTDRKVTFTPHTTRKGNYHHPRHLMLNLLALERMLERNSMVSDFWKQG